MFIPTINTDGREAPFSTPLGLEAKSLKNGMTHYWISGAYGNKTKQVSVAIQVSFQIHVEHIRAFK